MAISNNSLLPLIESQVPGFIRSENPQFVAFIKAYYEYMETSNNGAQLYHSKNLLDYKDIDRTTDDFIEYFKRDFLPYFPPEIALDERKMVKAAREFYQKKGSLESIKFLFRVLYNQDVDIFYPKENVLKASDGKWNQPQAIRLLLSPANENLNVNLLEKRQAIGETSRASCVVESANRVIDKSLNREIVELYISNLRRIFTTGENLLIQYYDENDDLQTFSEKIVGSISKINVDPRYTGLKYRGTERDGLGAITYQGDPVVLVGGLGVEGGDEAIAYVGNVSSGGIKSVSVTKGGYGFRVHPNTNVIIVNSPGDTGVGANVIVQSVDNDNTSFYNINIDAIEYIKNEVIGNTTYPGFTNVASVNANTVLVNAFSYLNVAVAPLKTLNVVSRGSGYKTEPTLDFDVLYNSDLANDYISTGNTAAYANTVQHLKDLGYILAVEINARGQNYDPAKDKIIFNSALGANANATFTVDANGAIDTVTMVDVGYGYFDMPTVRIANSSNTLAASNGSGASLTAYGFGSGEITSLSVDDVGRVQDIRVVSRGFNYVSAPNVSLRVQDLIINEIPTNKFFYESNVVYQGTDTGNATWIAYVDTFNRSNGLLRVYDHRGSINVYSNVIAPDFEFTVNTSVVGHLTTYGNGKARANAEFLNGLVRYNGFWSKTDGFLSWDQFLQDSEKYHNFSYEIAIEKSLEEFKQSLMNIIHPAGMSMLGLRQINREYTFAPSEETTIFYISPATGNVRVVGNVATGQATSFLLTAANGDMLVVNPDTDRELTLEIANVVSNTLMYLRSNSTYIANARLETITSNANVIVSTESTELEVGDKIRYLNGNAANTSNVVAVSGNAVQLNVASVANATNLVFSVTPTLNNVNYKIISV